MGKNTKIALIISAVIILVCSNLMFVSILYRTPHQFSPFRPNLFHFLGIVLIGILAFLTTIIALKSKNLRHRRALFFSNMILAFIYPGVVLWDMKLTSTKALITILCFGLICGVIPLIIPDKFYKKPEEK